MKLKNIYFTLIDERKCFFTGKQANNAYFSISISIIARVSKSAHCFIIIDLLQVLQQSLRNVK